MIIESRTPSRFLFVLIKEVGYLKAHRRSSSNLFLFELFKISCIISILEYLALTKSEGLGLLGIITEYNSDMGTLWVFLPRNE